jgi:ribosomal RNA methyltransferase Nop2
MGGRRAKYKQGPPAPLRNPDETRPSTKRLGKRKANVDHEPEPITDDRPAKKAKAGKPPVPEKRTKDLKVTFKPTPTKEKSKPLAEEGESDGWEVASDLEDVDAFAVDSLDDLDIDEE